jgi:hypothetical protein
MHYPTHKIIFAESKTHGVSTEVPLLAQHLLKCICDKKARHKYMFSWPRGKQD